MDAYDPSTWTEEYVRSNKSFCLSGLTNVVSNSIRAISDGDYQKALLGLSGTLQGLGKLDAAGCGNFTVHLCLLSWSLGNLTAIKGIDFGGNDLSNQDRIEGASLLYEAALECVNDATVRQDIQKKLRLLNTTDKYSFKRQAEPNFPQQTLIELNVLKRKMEELKNSSPRTASSSPSSKAPKAPPVTSEKRPNVIDANMSVQKMLVCGCDRVAGLTVDGRVLCHGSYDRDEDRKCSVVEDRSGDNLTTQVFFGPTTSVRMDAHGNLSAAGADDYGQVKPIALWKGPFVDVACDLRHTVGLRKDGTVVACGWNAFQQCNVSDWRDITAISVGLFHTLGLRKNGTVVGCGSNDDHQLDVHGWTDIVAIASSDNHSVGLKRDGTVVACGNPDDGAYKVSDWENIVKVICGNHHTVGLRNDGTVVACGDNETGVNALGGRCDVEHWKDVKDIACADYFTLGLKNDGTVLFTGENNNGVADVRQWTDIIHIVCNELAVFGLKKDGSVVTCGTGEFFSNEPVTKWKLFSSYETVKEDFQESLNRRIAAAASKKNTVSSKPSVENSTPTPVYAPKKSSKAWIWVLVILAILAAAAYFWIRRSPSEGSQEEPTTQHTTAAEVSVAHIIDTELLNLRAGPDKSYDVVTTMPKGAEVTVQKTEGDWACVSYQGQEGWCSLKYLSFDEQEAPSTEQTTAPDYPMAYVKVSSVLNLRTGPGKSYDLITTMPDGAKVYVQKTEGNWAYVSYQDQEGWCSLKYLSYAD